MKLCLNDEGMVEQVIRDSFKLVRLVKRCKLYCVQNYTVKLKNKSP